MKKRLLKSKPIILRRCQVSVVKEETKGALHVIRHKEGDRFIAHCLEFDLVAEGATREEARDNLADLIFSYLGFAVERGIEQFAYHPAPKVYWDRFKEISPAGS